MFLLSVNARGCGRFSCSCLALIVSQSHLHEDKEHRRALYNIV